MEKKIITLTEKQSMASKSAQSMKLSRTTLKLESIKTINRPNNKK